MLRAVREGTVLSARRCHIERVRMSVAAARPESHPSPTALAETMWSELHERLRAFVARRVSDHAVVDDLAQEILLRLYTHIGRLRDQERLDAWAYQVARNVIADYWRERAGRREQPFDLQHRRPASLGPGAPRRRRGGPTTGRDRVLPGADGRAAGRALP